MFNDIKKYIFRVIELMKKPEMLTLPASLAYYFVLAIVPIISILIIIAANLSLPTDFITNFFQKNFSEELVSFITPIITSQGFSIGYIIYLIIAFFLVSNGSDAIIVTSNTIFNIKNKSFINRRLKACLLTILLFFLLTFMITVSVFGEQLISISISLGLNSAAIKTIELLYPILNVPLSLLIIYMGIKYIYIIAPDEKIKSHYVIKGSLFTTIGWVLTTIGYSYYIKHFAKYNLYYAGLSSLVILMVWFYLLAVIFVIGLSMNYQIAENEIEKTNTIKLKELEEKVKASKLTD